MKALVTILGVALVLMGCSTLEVRKVSTLTLPPDRERDGIGIRYFLTEPAWKTTEKAAKDGRTKVDGCKVINIIEVALEPTYVPDPKHIYEVRLSPGFFSSDTFTVDLKEHGSLAKVFTKSEPQVAEAIKAAASIAGAAVAPITKAQEGPPAERPPECPAAPFDRELNRLRGVEEKLKDMLDVSLRKERPTKEDVEAIKLLQGELTATRIAIKAKQEAAEVWLDGNTATKMSYQRPDAWLWNKAFPTDKEILDEFEKSKKRVFIYVKPAVDFEKSSKTPAVPRKE